MALVQHKSFNFLVDVNLPRKFAFFNSPLFMHVVDIDPMMTDNEIWEYAIKNEKVILTKDANFYDRYISSKTTPKVVYLQLGNCTLKKLHKYFTDNWDSVISKLDHSSMVVLKKDQIMTFE